MRKFAQILSLLALLAVTACGATIRSVSATDADGDRYPWCVKVVQKVTPLSAKVLFIGCANVEADLAPFEAQANAIAAQNPGSVVRRIQGK
jgi:hypothetical protein